MAYILHIDTSAETGLTAIAKDGKVVAHVLNAETRNHAATINLHVEQVVKEASIELKDLSSISVCGGPGSYTGLRIGLSTAKGLCYVLNKPLLMHNKLALLATKTAYEKTHQHIVSVLQARDKEYFIAVYDSELNELVVPQHAFEEGIEELIQPHLQQGIFVGHTDDFLQELTQKNNCQLVNAINPNLESWARYSFECFGKEDFANLEYSEPFYLKQVYTHKPKKNK